MPYTHGRWYRLFFLIRFVWIVYILSVASLLERRKWRRCKQNKTKQQQQKKTKNLSDKCKAIGGQKIKCYKEKDKLLQKNKYF